MLNLAIHLLSSLIFSSLITPDEGDYLMKERTEIVMGSHLLEDISHDRGDNDSSVIVKSIGYPEILTHTPKYVYDQVMKV